MYVRFPLSLQNVEDFLFERGIDICHETVGFCWNRFGPLFAAELRRQRVSRMRGVGNVDRREMGPLDEQSGSKQPTPIPTTGEEDAAIKANEISEKIRVSPCRASQLFQSGTSSLRQAYLQRTTLGSPW